MTLWADVTLSGASHHFAGAWLSNSSSSSSTAAAAVSRSLCSFFIGGPFAPLLPPSCSLARSSCISQHSRSKHVCLTSIHYGVLEAQHGHGAGGFVQSSMDHATDTQPYISFAAHAAL